MKTFSKLLLTIALLFLLPAFANADANWQTLKTEHFTIFYSSGQEAVAWEVLQALEYYRPQVEKLCGNEIRHFPIVIDDVGTMTNGFTNPLYEQIHLFTYPPSGLSTLPVENWWSLVGVHEYTHQLSMSKTTAAAKILRYFFGNLLMPNVFIPGWIAEGMTVYSESQLDPFQGRLNDGLFDAYIGARIADGRWTNILDATYSPLEFQMSGIYTYGGEFFNYLAKTYGEEKFSQFFASNGAYPMLLIPAIGIDRAARNVYGKGFPELWKEWEAYESQNHQRYKMDGEPVTHSGWSTGYPVVAENKLYYKKEYYEKTGAFENFNFSEIIERDLTSSRERVLASAPAGFSIPIMKIRNGKLYYATNKIKSGFANSSLQGFGYLSAVHQIDLATGHNKTIIKEGLRSFEMTDDGRFIYSKDRANTFGSELYSYDPAAKRKQLLFISDYLVDEIVSGQSRVLVAARRDWENESIFSLNLERQEFTPVVATPYLEGGISLQGEKLFFTANYNRSYGIYCYDFASAKVYQATENGYAAVPAFNERENQLYYMGLSSYGFDIYRKPLELKEFALPQDPATVPPVFTLKETEVTKGSYVDNLKTLTPKTWQPVINVDETHDEKGIYFDGMDAVEDFQYSVMLTYDSLKEKAFTTGSLLVNYFNPVQTVITFDNRGTNDNGENLFIVDLAYPIPAGNWVYTLGSSFTYEDDYRGPEVAPYIGGSFQYAKTMGGIQIKAPNSRNVDDVERSGLYTDLLIRQYLPGSELDLKVSNIDDPDNPDDVFTKIRGYDDELAAKQGQIVSLDYSRPIWKIRNGFWNPNIYFEDLTAVIFADQAIPKTGDRQFSWGMEFHLETKATFLLSVDWGARLVRNIEGDNKAVLFVQSIF